MGPVIRPAGPVIRLYWALTGPEGPNHPHEGPDHRSEGPITGLQGLITGFEGLITGPERSNTERSLADWRRGGRAMPNAAMPRRAVLSGAMPSGAMPSRAMPSGAMPSRAVPSRAEPSRVKPGHAKRSHECVIAHPKNSQLAPTLFHPATPLFGYTPCTAGLCCCKSLPSHSRGIHSCPCSLQVFRNLLQT